MGKYKGHQLDSLEDAELVNQDSTRCPLNEVKTLSNQKKHGPKENNTIILLLLKVKENISSLTCNLQTEWDLISKLSASHSIPRFKSFIEKEGFKFSCF